MKITCKTTLLSPPMSVCTFTTTADAPCAGIYSAPLADGHDTVTIDWGDGTVERVPLVWKLIHTYAAPGTYEARISDDVKSISMSAERAVNEFNKKCSEQFRAFRSDATLLKELTRFGFAFSPNLTTLDVSQIPAPAIPLCLCVKSTNLSGRLDFPSVTDIAGSANTQPFSDCEGALEIHFAEHNRAAIEATAAYQADPKLGAANAVVSFDL